MNVIINWIYFTCGMGSDVIKPSTFITPRAHPLPLSWLFEGDISVFGLSFFFLFLVQFLFFSAFGRGPAAFITFQTFLLINHCGVNENGIQAYPK